MRNRRSSSVFRWMSLALILLAIVLTALQLVRFSRLWANFPPGLTIAGIPVGQLNRQQAAQRLQEAYSVPIEIHYNQAVIQLNPDVVGFELDIESMLAAADLERNRQTFWQAFWNFLWGRTSQPEPVPLRASISEERLRVFLAQEIATRYDQLAEPAVPIPGTVEFKPGEEGTALDIDRSVLMIENAMLSPSQRTATLTLQRTSPTRPTIQNLEVLLNQTIGLAGFDGLFGLYLLDLQTGQELSIMLNQGESVAVPPDVAFTASSTIKIPIMISVYRRLAGLLEPETVDNLEKMITQSNNTASDWLMDEILDPVTGPLVVTDDLQALGLENTFLAGYFYQGAPLLFRYRTPANTRTDIFSEPDIYSQTTPSEMGLLLNDIYQCAQNGGGALLAAFPGEITQSECQSMLDYLIRDRNPWLILAGLPDGTRVAHKHGWVTDAFGIIHDMSDAGIVFTPGGNYVLSIFLYNPTQLVFDPSNELVKSLSRAVFNYYNLPQNP